MDLSIIIPVYNEERTLPIVLKRLKEIRGDFEVIVINDCSTDSTQRFLDNISAKDYSYKIKTAKHKTNMGKGKAIRTGLDLCEGKAVIIQDADLEYSPAEIPGLVVPIAEGGKKAVFGSRLISGTNRVFSRWYVMGNRFLTFLINFLCDWNYTDSYTCYKAFDLHVFKEMELESDGFEIEAEIAVKTAMRKLDFEEIPISYVPRSKEEGKKIRFSDALKGMVTIFKFWRLEKRGF
jgi:glycosyltransferase involved in cell wall biosynthesis